MSYNFQTLYADRYMMDMNSSNFPIRFVCGSKTPQQLTLPLSLLCVLSDKGNNPKSNL